MVESNVKGQTTKYIAMNKNEKENTCKNRNDEDDDDDNVQRSERKN